MLSAIKRSCIPGAQLFGGKVQRKQARRIVTMRSSQSGDFVSNLGSLSGTVRIDDEAQSFANVQLVSPDSFAEQGIYFDAGAVGASLLLLVILLGLSFERILGLDRVIMKALKAWKSNRAYEKRNEIIDARQQLEQLWSKDNPEQPK